MLFASVDRCADAILYAPVAQLDRVFGYEPEGCRFDPCRAHHFFFPWKPQSVTYQVLMGSAPRILTLAEEIKASEPRFIDAACAALRKNLTEEYCRLRGYAIEAQRDEITLNVSIVFGFAPENRYVAVSSTPAVNPRPASNMVTVSPPL